MSTLHGSIAVCVVLAAALVFVVYRLVRQMRNTPPASDAEVSATVPEEKPEQDPPPPPVVYRRGDRVIYMARHGNQRRASVLRSGSQGLEPGYWLERKGKQFFCRASDVQPVA